MVEDRFSLYLNHLGVANLRDVTLSIRPGEIVCLSGPSGCGKSRLLRAIADLEPYTGEVRLGDTAAARVSGHRWRAQVMMVPAESHWWEFDVNGHFASVQDEDLAALGFSREVLDWEVSRLSSGEKQRLALLRVLSREPAALLLDEPTANLDPDTTHRVENWLCAHIRERQLPTLWVTHDLEQVQRVGDRHLYFNDHLQLEVA